MRFSIFLRQVYYIGLMIIGANLLALVLNVAFGWEEWRVIAFVYGGIAAYYLSDKAEADVKRALR